ncbi:cora-domain-containing protein [Thelephora ganbajun]|uniref:Cora-domain-containing protein n=1 Tax=Thelephora ganbajun TaxID=370292 RepID=A0ACB6ZQL7_THEGA|nr:cora-domain-containing protein [Thelephora ganbajun]
MDRTRLSQEAEGDADATIRTSTGFTLPPRRPRERKLSSNTGHTRRGKMALFEQVINNSSGRPLSTHVSIPEIPEGNFPPSSENIPAPTGGHDRPYRFSFYSNALSQTIHSRSLSELPAEGQSFEELFTGILPPGLRSSVLQSSSTSPGTNGNGDEGSKGAPTDFAIPMGLEDQMKKRNGDPDPEMATWWLDVMSPTDEEMKMLSHVFGIHPLTTEDIQMEEAREKIELFRNYYFVCFRSFDQDPYSPTHLDPINMYVIVFREGTLSFHFRPTPHPQNVRRRIKQLKDYISVTSDWISYALIDDITDAFGPLIQGIEYEVDSIDELVLILKDAEQSDMLRRIGTCRKKVMGLLRLMGNKADVVKGLAKRCNENWRVAPTSDIGLYLSDIQDHLITMTQSLNHYEKILSRSHSNYLAQISIEMTDANNQINDVLSKLTALGTVLIPLNLVTGLWGMNVHVPGQDVPGYGWFAGIIACLAAIAVIGGWSAHKLMTRR